MKPGREHTQFPPRYLALCRLAEQLPSSVAGLPDSCRAIEKAIDEALHAEKKNLPMPTVMAFQVCLERDMRLVVRRAFAQLRWIDIHIQRLQDQRREIVAVLGE